MQDANKGQLSLVEMSSGLVEMIITCFTFQPNSAQFETR